MRIYPQLFNLVFRRMDPEQAHHLGFGAIRAVGSVPGGLALLERLFQVRDDVLRQTVFGVDFPAPFGLAAGFDKNAEGIDALAALGFGFVEIGTVTGQSQPGNERPRLSRLVADRAVVNRMGFNNEGAEEIARRLKRRVAKPERWDWDVAPPIVGVNIGKTKVVPEAEAASDYVASTKLLAPYADYLVVNVSSPNTPGLRSLQAVEVLRPLLKAVRQAADAAVPGRHVPLLVKIAPDLADDDVDAVADLALELGLDGIIATNTTIGRSGLRSASEKVDAAGAGGLSGAPLKARSLEVLKRLRARTDGRLALISVGGIETAADAWQRLVAGADLVQGYTGFIYEGPAWAARINRGLAEKIRSEGYTNLRDAVDAARVS